MNYNIKFGKKFDKEFKKIDKSISDQIFKKIERLEIAPSSEGKPLLYTKPTLWQLKAHVYRIFYILDYNKKEILILSIKHKDECDKYIRKGYFQDIREFSNDASS